jgi:hypothetical protein
MKSEEDSSSKGSAANSHNENDAPDLTQNHPSHETAKQDMKQSVRLDRPSMVQSKSSEVDCIHAFQQIIATFFEFDNEYVFDIRVCPRLDDHCDGILLQVRHNPRFERTIESTLVPLVTYS